MHRRGEGGVWVGLGAWEHGRRSAVSPLWAWVVVVVASAASASSVHLVAAGRVAGKRQGQVSNRIDDDDHPLAGPES